jgi:predicted small lipoprotein YifL
MALLTLGLLAGCGQKGPLYLPKPDKRTPPPNPVTKSAPRPATLGQPRSTAQPARLPRPETYR